MSDKFHYSLQEEKDESDNMIFPLNIQAAVTNKSAMTENEKITLYIGLWACFCAIIGWLLASFLLRVAPNYAIQITIFFLLLLNGTVGVYLLRFVLNERSVIKEYESADGASFSTFFQIYKDTQLTLDNKYGVIEYSNGTYGVFLRLRVGYNTNTFAANTWMYMRDAARIITSSGFTFRAITSTEDFKDSDTCQFMLDRLNAIKQPELRTAQKEIIRGLLDAAEQQSNVPIVHILIFAQTQIQKDELLSLIHRLERHFVVEQTCFRDVKFLNSEEILAFLREYYELEVLDMSLLRAQKLTTEIMNVDNFELLRLYGSSGKVYSTESMEELNSKIVKETGIRKVN